jgi:hypothetical protein
MVLDEGDILLKRCSKYMGITTNNQAEYEALMLGRLWNKGLAGTLSLKRRGEYMELFKRNDP